MGVDLTRIKGFGYIIDLQKFRESLGDYIVDFLEELEENDINYNSQGCYNPNEGNVFIYNDHKIVFSMKTGDSGNGRLTLDLGLKDDYDYSQKDNFDDILFPIFEKYNIPLYIVSEYSRYEFTYHW